MGRAQVNGITMGFDDTGGGDNVVVLVHGHPFDRSMWRPQIPALERAGWRIIVPDLRGYGGSSLTGPKTTLEQFARDISALLDALGIERVVLGGLSMGGQIVMEFCRLYPERVRGIVLAATFPQAETEEGKRNRNLAADRLLREGMAPFAEEALPRMVASHNIVALPEVAEHVLTMMRNANPAGAAAALRGRAERPSYDETLAGLDIPALVVVGDADAFTTRADADRMRTLLRRSDLVWMEGAGHMPNLERAAEFNAALDRFVRGLQKTALVTGASAGFGAAIARRFAASGVKVIACARRFDKLAALAEEFGRNRILPLGLDVQSRVDVEGAIADLPPAFAQVDWLINNAGVALGVDPAPRADLSEWERMIDTNCKGLVYVTRALLPGMLARGRGHVVNVGSVAGTYPYPGGNVYGATKAFVRQFSLNLRSDLHGTGIRVTSIEPGMCGGTEFSEVRYGGDKDKAAAVYAGMEPLRAEDVAEAIFWATSLPAHVNVNSIELMPIAQSFAPFQVHRTA